MGEAAIPPIPIGKLGGISAGALAQTAYAKLTRLASELHSRLIAVVP
jgi:hypothetical protein